MLLVEELDRNQWWVLLRPVCGYCGWSWSVGKEGQILCLNPESFGLAVEVREDLRTNWLLVQFS